MKPIPTYIAKAKLSELLRRASDGETIYIGRGSDLIVQLVPVHRDKNRRFGALAGQASTTDAFFDPLPSDELDAWDK